MFIAEAFANDSRKCGIREVGKPPTAGVAKGRLITE